MTDEEYRKKQRLLIILFTIGAVTILGIFVFSLSRTFSDLQISNPVDEVIDEEDVDEFNRLRQSIDSFNSEFEAIEEEEDAAASQSSSEENSSSVEDSDDSNLEADTQDSSVDETESINQFIQD